MSVDPRDAELGGALDLALDDGGVVSMRRHGTRVVLGLVGSDVLRLTPRETDEVAMALLVAGRLARLAPEGSEVVVPEQAPQVRVDLDEVRLRGRQVAQILQMVVWPGGLPAVFGLHLSGDVGQMLQEIEELRAIVAARRTVSSREEWGIQHYDGPIEHIGYRPKRIHSPNIHVWRRTVDTLADGSTVTSAWSPVERKEPAGG